MKTEEEIRAQRDWFWVQANALENEGDQLRGEAFAILVGTLDWVLDEIQDAEVTDED